MNGKIKKSAQVVLTIMFMISICMLGINWYQSKSAEKKYEEAESIAKIEETTKVPETEIEIETSSVEPDTTPAETRPSEWTEIAAEDDEHIKNLESIHLDSLRETNEDVLGWITIPDTQVNYPIMDGEDNDYYLHHTWDRESSKAGSIFLEKLNASDLSDFNTIVYGHRMLNGSMFGSLKYYNSVEYYKEHPYVYVKDDEGIHRYEIFSAYTAPVDGLTFIYGFRTEESMQEFLDYCLEKSEIETGVIPTLDDRILTLVTCTGNGYEARWVVQARLKGMEDNPRKLYQDK